MDEFAISFSLERTRSRDGAIVDASGRSGYWPFRRVISFHVGVNCDAISVSDGRLRVQRRGRTIAFAALIGAPSPLGRLLRSGWASLLHPRHANGEGEPAVKWEDLLRRQRNR